MLPWRAPSCPTRKPPLRGLARSCIWMAPVCVLRVRAGRAGDLYRGPWPSEPMGMEGTFAAKMERPAWHVDFATARPDLACDASGGDTEFLILDRERVTSSSLVVPRKCHERFAWCGAASGATHLNRLARALLAVVLVLAAACCGASNTTRQPSPLRTEADAISRGRELVRLNEPVCVLEVRAGRARELFDGAHPSFGDRAAADEYWGEHRAAGLASRLRGPSAERRTRLSQHRVPWRCRRIDPRPGDR